MFNAENEIIVRESIESNGKMLLDTLNSLSKNERFHYIGIRYNQQLSALLIDTSNPLKIYHCDTASRSINANPLLKRAIEQYFEVNKKTLNLQDVSPLRNGYQIHATDDAARLQIAFKILEKTALITKTPGLFFAQQEAGAPVITTHKKTP